VVRVKKALTQRIQGDTEEGLFAAALTPIRPDYFCGEKTGAEVYSGACEDFANLQFCFRKALTANLLWAEVLDVDVGA
jgi:hypothetical protein